MLTFRTHMMKWDKLVSEYAKEKGIPVAEMHVICESPFKFLKEVVVPQKKTFRLTHFGMFYSPEWYTAMVDKRKAISKERYENRREALEKMKEEYEANRNK